MPWTFAALLVQALLVAGGVYVASDWFWASTSPGGPDARGRREAAAGD